MLEVSGLPGVLQAVLFLVSVVLLAKGADWLVDGASDLARRFGVSELIVGLTVVAFGTSAPEFAVSTLAAWKGAGEIAIGNVVGSDIFNLGFILGMLAIAKPLPASRELLWRDCLTLVAAGGLVLVFMSTGSAITRLEGGVLFSALIVYLLFLAIQAQARRRGGKEEVDATDIDSTRSAALLIGLVLVGLVSLAVGSKLLVETSSTFARWLGISDWVIGVVIVAIGTSLPEFLTAVVSIYTKRFGIGIGALIGSNIFNIFGVIGVAALINPLGVGGDMLVSSYGVMLMALIVTACMVTGRQISRLEGGFLVLVAAVRWAYELMGTSLH